MLGSEAEEEVEMAVESEANDEEGDIERGSCCCHDRQMSISKKRSRTSRL